MQKYIESTICILSSNKRRIILRYQLTADFYAFIENLGIQNAQNAYNTRIYIKHSKSNVAVKKIITVELSQSTTQCNRVSLRRKKGTV